MTPPPAARLAARLAGVALMAAALARCGENVPGYGPPSTLPAGRWGGQDVGVIVDDSVAHVHVGCTLGSFRAPVSLDAAGRFDVAGSYVLRAYPVAVGPSLPARFAGTLVGARLALTVTVTDTVEKRTVALGPSTVTLGVEPRMGPCPICRRPGERRRATLERAPR